MGCLVQFTGDSAANYFDLTSVAIKVDPVFKSLNSKKKQGYLTLLEPNRSFNCTNVGVLLYTLPLVNTPRHIPCASIKRYIQ